MKLRLILYLLLFLQTGLFAYNSEINFIREQFYKAVEDEDALINLENFIHSRYSEDTSAYPPVILAYKGGVEALKAKYTFSPFSKFSHVVRSLEILDEAVLKLPESLEVRFIRYSILDNVPSILGYGAERKSDKEMVIRQLLKNDFSTIDKKTQKGIIEYLINSDSLTETELNELTANCTALRE